MTTVGIVLPHSLGLHWIVAEVVAGNETPLLGKGGVAAPLRKCREATLTGADGGVRSRELSWSLKEPPRPRLSKEREYFLMARHPLLCQGGVFRALLRLRQPPNL